MCAAVVEQYVARKYLMVPSDIRALPSSDALKLGLMKDFTYKSAMKDAKKQFSAKKHLLICTIEFKSTTTQTISAAIMDENLEIISAEPIIYTNPDDQCYPISDEEWSSFLRDDNETTRTSVEIWVVDGTKYTAPI